MVFSFSSTNLPRIQQSLSVPRLDRYMHMAKGDLKLALAFHNWNTALGSSLHLPLQIFELSFRNCLHDSLSGRFGHDWYDSQFAILDADGQRTVTVAKDKLIKQGRPISSPPVIAQFTFGFWLNLLKRRYETPFWIPAIKNGFTHAPKPVMRQATFDAVDKIRNLRNRIAHHEPIYTRDLRAELKHVTHVAAWICPDTAQWIEHCGADLLTVLAKLPK